jgi:hypothetical protein
MARATRKARRGTRISGRGPGLPSWTSARFDAGGEELVAERGEVVRVGVEHDSSGRSRTASMNGPSATTLAVMSRTTATAGAAQTHSWKDSEEPSEPHLGDRRNRVVAGAAVPDTGDPPSEGVGQ